jgi:hypothetical protein
MKVVTGIAYKDGIIEVDEKEIHPQVVTFDDLLVGPQRFKPDWWQRLWLYSCIVLWIVNGLLVFANQCFRLGQ